MWGDAHRSLTIADSESGLGPDELERLATAAFMLGRDDEYVAALERAHDDRDGDGHRRWVREAADSLKPFSTGGTYINFQTADEGEDRVRAAYGANYERLAAVKRDYDPGNLFRSNRNVPPAGG